MSALPLKCPKCRERHTLNLRKPGGRCNSDKGRGRCTGILVLVDLVESAKMSAIRAKSTPKPPPDPSDREFDKKLDEAIKREKAEPRKPRPLISLPLDGGPGDTKLIDEQMNLLDSAGRRHGAVFKPLDKIKVVATPKDPRDVRWGLDVKNLRNVESVAKGRDGGYPRRKQKRAVPRSEKVDDLSDAERRKLQDKSDGLADLYEKDRDGGPIRRRESGAE